MTFIPYPQKLHINGNRLLIRTVFEEFHTTKAKTQKQVTNEKNLRENFPSGLPTRKIRQKMQRIIDCWIKALHYSQTNTKGYSIDKVRFVTLTLPAEQMHSDKELNSKGLARFIQRLKRLGYCRYYLWRAERQKNGNIHYHILVDKFIPWEMIRSEWNTILNDLGYIAIYRENRQTFFKNGFRFDKEAFEKSKGKFDETAQKKAYQKGLQENWTNPNTTDIHDLKKVKNVSAYVTKYCTKSPEYDSLQKINRALSEAPATGLSDIQITALESKKQALNKEIEKNKINGRCWGCSDELKTLKECTLYIDGSLELAEFINEAKTEYIQKEVDLDHTTILYCKDLQPLVKKYKTVYKALKDHYEGMYKTLYPPPLSKRKKKEKSLFVVPSGVLVERPAETLSHEPVQFELF